MRKNIKAVLTKESPITIVNKEAFAKNHNGKRQFHFGEIVFLLKQW